MDTETPQWAAFLEAWHESLGDKPITAKEMANYIKENDELRTALPDAIDDPEVRSYSVKLGQRLARRNGVRYPNGLSLVKAGEKKHAATWKVVRFENETSPGFSLKGEVGEVISTSARIERHEDKNHMYISKGCTTSPNLTSASKMGEVAINNTLPSPDNSEPVEDLSKLRETHPKGENPESNEQDSSMDDYPDYPAYPCPACGSTDYWLTDWNEWLCSRCHPRPSGGDGQ
jgi:hypothetical protein